MSGAREGVDDFGPMPLPKVKLSVDDPSLEEYNRGRDILSNGWARYGSSSLLTKDAASAEWTPEQVMLEAGRATKDWLAGISGRPQTTRTTIPNNTLQDRQQRKQNLKPMPQARTARPATVETEDDSPQAAVRAIQKSRGQAY